MQLHSQAERIAKIERVNRSLRVLLKDRKDEISDLSADVKDAKEHIDQLYAEIADIGSAKEGLEDYVEELENDIEWYKEDIAEFKHQVAELTRSEERENS